MEHITKVKDLYEQTVSMISQSEESWKDFLECMGRLYQLDFLNTCWRRGRKAGSGSGPQPPGVPAQTRV